MRQGQDHRDVREGNQILVEEHTHQTAHFILGFRVDEFYDFPRARCDEKREIYPESYHTGWFLL